MFIRMCKAEKLKGSRTISVNTVTLEKDLWIELSCEYGVKSHPEKSLIFSCDANGCPL